MNYQAVASEAMPLFDSVRCALSWSTEVLRRRRHPHSSRWQQESLSEQINQEFSPSHGHDLPSHPQDRYFLAQDIQNLLNMLTKDEQSLISRRYWGDYHHPQVLASAQAIQENARRTGKRVRLRYIYTTRQLAQQDSTSERTIRRRLKKAEETLARVMVSKGLLPNVDSAE